MKSVGKFLATISVCGGLLMAVWTLTPATAVTTDAVPVASISMEGVAQPISPSDPDPAHLQDDVLETLSDGCSRDVVVKVPHTGPNAPSLDDNDIILARSKAFCGLAEPPSTSGLPRRGVCQHNPNENSDFTVAIQYSSIRNSARRFRWFCGKTAERSRCRQGTRRVRFRIGPDRLFETQCLQ
jgi:hypothetical protein